MVKMRLPMIRITYLSRRVHRTQRNNQIGNASSYNARHGYSLCTQMVSSPVWPKWFPWHLVRAPISTWRALPVYSLQQEQTKAVQKYPDPCGSDREPTNKGQTASITRRRDNRTGWPRLKNGQCLDHERPRITHPPHVDQKAKT